MYAIDSKEVMPYFLGTWQVKRDISNFGEISGEAVFKPHTKVEGYLDYREAMVLPNSPNQKPNAFRAYQYRITEAGFDIFFADSVNEGELFLSFCFTQASILTSHHLCINDHYDAKFTFLTDDLFELSFSVVGPKKDYRIQTCFTRLPT